MKQHREKYTMSNSSFTRTGFPRDADVRTCATIDNEVPSRRDDGQIQQLLEENNFESGESVNFDDDLLMIGVMTNEADILANIRTATKCGSGEELEKRDNVPTISTKEAQAVTESVCICTFEGRR